MKNIWEKIWTMFENLMKHVVNKVLCLEISEETWNSIVQFIKFGIVGLTNTIIGYLIYAISLKGIRIAGIWGTIDIYIAQLIMFLLSVLWSFYWNSKAVFKAEEGEKRNLFTALMKTYVSYAFTSLFLSEILLHLWVGVLGISEYVAPIINLIITVPLNFIIQKFWAFRRR